MTFFILSGGLCSVDGVPGVKYLLLDRVSTVLLAVPVAFKSVFTLVSLCFLTQNLFIENSSHNCINLVIKSLFFVKKAHFYVLLKSLPKAL